MNKKDIIKYLVPTSLWRRLRLRCILKSHKVVAEYWDNVIEKYRQGKIPLYPVELKKPELVGQKIIWQYWGQGIDDVNMPEIVRICMDSVDKHKGSFTVIRLRDTNFEEYVKMPEFVKQRFFGDSLERGRTHFSDVLRLALLATYGGVWLDATIYLTGELSKTYCTAPFFAYTRSESEPHKRFWEDSYAYYYSWHKDFQVRMLNSIMFSKCDNELTSCLLQMMLYYWDMENTVSDYFFFQILFNRMVKDNPNNALLTESDTIPHYLQTEINGTYPYKTLQEILSATNIHKMSYLSNEAMAKFRKLQAEIEDLQK